MIGLRDQLASFTVPYVPATPAHPVGGHGDNAWQMLIDEQLIEWGRNLEQFREEGLTPPTDEALAWTCQFAVFCRDRQVEPPLRMAPDGSGGVAFEWRIGPVFHTVEVHRDGSIEMLSFENSTHLSHITLG